MFGNQCNPAQYIPAFSTIAFKQLGMDISLVCTRAHFEQTEACPLQTQFNSPAYELTWTISPSLTLFHEH